MCVCKRVPSVDNRTGLFVLQHPRERLHPIGTARFAHLGLRKVRVEVAWNAGVIEHERPGWLPEGTALLYPAPDARDLSELGPSERPQHLLVLDGTWHTAGTLYRDKTWLKQLPHLRFSPFAPSRYRLRREPERDYVSTIEAIVEALRVLEPETLGLDALLGAFDSMIDQQMEHVLRRAGDRQKRTRRPEAHRHLPEALVSGLSRVVVVYAESVRASESSARELVQVTACGVTADETRQWHLFPSTGVPSPHLLGYMKLAPDDFANAVDVATFRREWQGFLAARAQPPILAAWNQSTIDLLAGAGAAVPSPLLLKSAYRARSGIKHASLDDVVNALSLDVTAPSMLRGRAARRLACAIAVARHLHAGSYAERTMPGRSAGERASKSGTAPGDSL
jgi:DTW domain-containing protein YfiP